MIKFLILVLSLSYVFASPLKVSTLSCSSKKCEFVFQFSSSEKLPRFFHKYSVKEQAYVVAFQGIDIAKMSFPLESELKSSGLTSLTVKKQGNVTKFLLRGPLAKSITWKQTLKNATFSLRSKALSRTKFNWSLKSALLQQKRQLKKENAKAKKLTKPKAVAAPKKVKKAVSKQTPVAQASKSPKTMVAAPESLQDFYKEASKKSAAGTFVLTGNSALVVTKNSLNVYVKPSTKSETLTKLSFGEKLQMVELHNKNWYKVKFAGRVGFAESKALRLPRDLSEKESEKLRNLAERQRDDLKSAKKTIPARNGEVLLADLKPTLIKKKGLLLYTSYGRRDPFVPLEQPEVDGLSIDEVQLVGIIWDETSSLAIFEDVRKKGVSYTLKEGDSIIHGLLEKINQHDVVFSLTEFGVTHKYVMELPSLEEE